MICITISWITLAIVNPHAISVEKGMTKNPILISDSVTEVDVVVLITIVSIVFSTVVIVL